MIRAKVVDDVGVAVEGNVFERLIKLLTFCHSLLTFSNSLAKDHSITTNNVSSSSENVFLFFN